MMHRYRLCLLSIVALNGQALAQDAGILLNEQIRQQADEARMPVSADRAAPLSPLPAPATESDGDSSVAVARLIFTGQTDLLSANDRQALEGLAIGQRLDINGLQALADRTTLLLQQQGELLAYANLPPQDVTEGHVTLDIRQGNLSGIQVERSDKVRLHADRIEAIGERALAGGATRDNLTAGLLRMNDLPGISARGSLSPGATPDSSVLTVRVDEGRPIGLSLSGNNYGVDTTGDIQSAATLRFNNLSGYGDSSAFTYSRADGQDYLAFNGRMPLGATPFTATASYGNLDYAYQTEPGRTLQLEGDTHRATLGLDYALLRSRTLRLDLNADYLQQRLKDDSIAGRLSDKDIDAWRIGVSGDVRDTLGQGGITLFSAMLTAGELDLSKLPAALAADRASLDTHGTFHTVNLNLIRYQYLPNNLTVYTRLYSQWTDQNLDSSQKLSLGGPYGLRGWPVAEAQGDSGILGTMELRYRVPQWSTDNSVVQVAAFIDGGRVSINEDPAGIPATNACACNRYTLKSAGLSLNWQFQILSLSATWARGLGSNPGRSAITGNNIDGSDDQQQLWLRLGLDW